MEIPNRSRRQLSDKIASLSKTEHDEIFKILQHNNISYTSNKNGVFFNISKVSDEVCQQLQQFVVFCSENKIHLDEYDKRMNECKNSVFYQDSPQQQYTIANGSVGGSSTKTQDVVLPQQTASKIAEQWSTAIDSMGEDDRGKTLQYLDQLSNRMPKACKKKSASKFNVAKKKYSKRIMSDKKNEFEHESNMEREEYLIQIVRAT